MRAARLAAFLALISMGANAQATREMYGRYGQALTRSSAAVAAYATSVGLDGSWVQYCLTEMNRRDEHPQDGSIPFGYSMNTAKDDDTYKAFLQVKEVWMRNEQILCLARVKAAMNGAASK